MEFIGYEIRFRGRKYHPSTDENMILLVKELNSETEELEVWAKEKSPAKQFKRNGRVRHTGCDTYRLIRYLISPVGTTKITPCLSGAKNG